MRISTSAAIVTAWAAYAQAADTDVHLQDFPPHVSNLPPACQSVYTQSISGCSSADFSGPTCGVGCIQALETFQNTVIFACAGAGVSGNNVLVAFLNKLGPQSLCSNAASVLASLSSSSSSSSSSPAPSNTATLLSATSTKLATTSQSSTALTTSTAVLTSSSTVDDALTASSLATSSSVESIVATTSSPPALSSTVASTSTSADRTSSTTSPSNPQSTDAHSGGGSPFDSSSSAGTSAYPVPAACALLMASLSLLCMLR